MTTTVQIADPSVLIAGEWLRCADRYEVLDPATGSVVGWADDAGPDEARAAVDAAADAAAGWRGRAPMARAHILRTASHALRRDAEELARILTLECGKPLAEARGEIASAVAALDWAAEEGRRVAGRLVPLGEGRRGVVFKQPVGITVAISPWNFPASMFLRKVGLALAAGCTVIAKPAEQTPLIARALVARLLDAGLPGGVLNLLTTNRPGDVVEVLLADPRVAKVSFTGSTEVGLMLLRRDAGRLKHVALELGGHAPAIVLDDADLEAAVASIVASKFRGSGQSCIATNRVYVPEALHDRFIALLVERVSALRVGAGSDESVEVGPLIDDGALAKLQRQVDDAVANGAKVLVGGGRLGDGEYASGHFFGPTVLTGVSDKAALATEEIFGPVLPVYTYRAVADVVARANATDYGLAAYLYGGDTSQMLALAEQLDFGVIGINDPFPLAPELPFGGMKNSGLGREGGLEGIDGFIETKAVAVHV